MQWIIGPLKKYADFNGRASRSEFWLFLLFVTLLTVAAHFVDGPDGRDVAVAMNMGIVELSVTLLFLLPSITVGVRRLHDTGRSGWWTMLVYLPWLATLVSQSNPALVLASAGALLVGGIAWLILLLLPGEAGENAFGLPPS
jgi:uncharacterized membrane protein YhaH (DUF805 family)